MSDNNVNNFLLCVQPSPDDERDWIAENIFSKLLKAADVYDLRNDLNTVRNQGRQGSCAAQTAACMKEWQEKQNIGYDNYMSPQFIYNNRVNQDGEGMYGRDVMKILNKTGIVEEKFYKYGLIEKQENIDENLYERAINYKIKGYAKILTMDGLKKALQKNGPCYVSFPVYNFGKRFWKSDSSKRKGGHAVTIVGYNELGFIIRNSWGTGWNGNGYTIYSYEDWGSHWEIYTTIDDNSSKILPDDPKDNPEDDSEEDDNSNNQNIFTKCFSYLKKILICS